eukprot:CAMPEP_0183704216 /NCGR_PEP_ID=MMETSP0737-20130205/1621_1 /TAXON_ID=385413 /ORGANISM="Thalassiosira miniscula, Strain CCMP1093" /LENGTH=366 /DNA_ID=CAMNT_0025931041 /DNA_START=174 /DNA_END=1274 /DNA_ORIENTATION=-
MLNAKNISLLAGIFQQAALVLIIRYSKTRKQDEVEYLNSVAVASAEVFKLCLSFILEFISTKKNKEGINNTNGTKGGHISHLKRMFKPMLVFNDKESVKLVIPALLYLIQNNLLFVALANLSVGMYQVTNQGKLLTTALLSRIMLKNKISGMQYVSIALLGFGVAFIHLSEYHAKEESVSTASSATTATKQNQILGLMSVLVCCLTSSFSGVYFEFILKKSPTQLSVHCRNFHLASWSFFLATVHILLYDNDQVMQYGLFHGFDIYVVLVVVAQGMTGFVVSMMIKYADTVLKGFAISIAAVLATLLSVPLFGAHISSSFVAGALMVVSAVKMYSHYGIKIEESNSKKDAENKDEEIGLISKEKEE